MFCSFHIQTVFAMCQQRKWWQDAVSSNIKYALFRSRKSAACLQEEARGLGCTRCHLVAHIPAVPFYERLGYTYVTGDKLVYDGIEVVSMEFIF